MNFFEKYQSPASFLRSPDDGSGAPSPATGSSPGSSGGDPGGGAGVPSPSPVDTGSAGASNSQDEFASFGDQEDLDSIELGNTDGGEPQPSPQPTAVKPPVVPAATPVAPAPTEVKPPVAPAASTEGASAPPPSELDSLVSSIDANAKELTAWLAQNAFAMSKEEAEAFELDAVANIPSLMAKVAVNNMKSTMNIVKNLVPKLIAAEFERLSGTKEKAREALSEFYSANQHLNEKEHGALVTKWANAFRAANPKASRKEAIEYVGRAVSFETGLMPGAQSAAPKAAPFQPARPGGRQPVTQVQETSPYTGLGMDFDEG